MRGVDLDINPTQVNPSIDLVNFSVDRALGVRDQLSILYSSGESILQL